MNVDSPKIIYPLPGDQAGKPLRSFVTDSQGKFSGQIQFNGPGRYSIYAATADQRVRSNPVVVQVLPKCQSKGDIRQGNKLIRATIRAATNTQEIESQLKKSKLYVDCSSENLRKVALREYEETSETTHKRIEELRLTDRRFGVSVNPQEGFSLDYGVRKSSI